MPTAPPSDRKLPTTEVLLVEYQTAQDSAQHHDNLLWTVTSLMWGASLLLLGFLLEHTQPVTKRPLVLVLSALGFLLSLFVLVFSLQLRRLKNQKYRRCRQLEKRLDLKQHTRTTRNQRRVQRFALTVFNMILVVVWLTTLLVTSFGASTPDPPNGMQATAGAENRSQTEAPLPACRA